MEQGFMVYGTRNHGLWNKASWSMEQRVMVLRTEKRGKNCFVSSFSLSLRKRNRKD